MTSSERNWKLAAGGTQHTAAKIEFTDFIAAVSERTFKAFIRDVCLGDGFAQILLGVGDPEEAIDQLVIEIHRESRRTREQLAKWAQIREWQKMDAQVIRRYLCVAKALPGVISPQALKRFIRDEKQPSHLRALAASSIAQFPPETVYPIWKALPLAQYPECLGAALVSVAQIDPGEALNFARHATTDDYERIAYSIVNVMQLLVEHSSDPIEIRRVIDATSTLSLVTTSYDVAGLPLPASIASMSRLEGLNAVTTREFLIDQHQFGMFEKRIRRWRGFELSGVYPIVPKIEVPHNSLREAVLGHVEEGIPYKFYMPANIGAVEFEDLLGIYRTMVRSRYPYLPKQLEKMKLISGVQIEGVPYLPYPYVFYELRRNGERIVLGLRGADKDCGIAKHYFPIEEPEATTILALLGGRIKWPTLVDGLSNTQRTDSERAVRELVREAVA